jgi:HSP20 family protein
MTLVLRDPWRMMNSWRKELDEGKWPRFSFDDTQVEGGDWLPAVDIKEEEGRYLLHADIPGVEPEDIEVSMENGVLTIKGERKHETSEEKEGYTRIERSHGSFYRRFALPDNVDSARIAATGKDGVLEVSIPKTEAVKPRRIEVKH